MNLRSLLRRLPQSRLFRVGISVTGWVCLVYLAVTAGCSYLQVELYKDAIPPEFEIERVVFHDESSDLREGCGIAIFEVSRETLARFERRGEAFLDTATLGRAQDPTHQYQPWRATPPPQGVQLLRGGAEGCIKGPPPVWQEIIKAARGGGFFTTGPEKDLLFLPRLGILVLSHFG